MPKFKVKVKRQPRVKKQIPIETSLVVPDRPWMKGDVVICTLCQKKIPVSMVKVAKAKPAKELAKPVVLRPKKKQVARYKIPDGMTEKGASYYCEKCMCPTCKVLLSEHPRCKLCKKPAGVIGTGHSHVFVKDGKCDSCVCSICKADLKGHTHCKKCGILVGCGHYHAGLEKDGYCRYCVTLVAREKELGVKSGTATELVPVMREPVSVLPAVIRPRKHRSTKDAIRLLDNHKALSEGAVIARRKTLLGPVITGFAAE
jgi:hypothetical protein